MALQVLHPAGLSVDDVVGSLRDAEVPADRPYVVVNFVSTVDGSVALGGESGSIAKYAPGDRPLFWALREQADAVLTGTTTIVREGYQRLIRDPAIRARRVAAGRPADPLAVVLARDGNVPEGVPMLDDADQPKRVFTHEGADPTSALRSLRHEDGVSLLLCEGGPRLLSELVRRDLVDELFLTTAPVLGSGAPEATLLTGEPDRHRPLELRALLTEGGGLHARYAMLATGRTPSSQDPPGVQGPQ